MALTPAQIKQHYPLPAYNYRVDIGGTAIACSEVSGLAVQYEPITYKHGLSWRNGADYILGQKQPARITLRRGLTKNGRHLYDWIQSTQQNKGERRDIKIHLCDENGIQLISWQVLQAIPLKLDAPSFNADSNEVAIESIELMAETITIAFHG